MYIVILTVVKVGWFKHMQNAASGSALDGQQPLYSLALYRVCSQPVGMWNGRRD